jgi:Dna[CI] antecedent, DciA
MIQIKNILQSLIAFKSDWKFIILTKWPDIVGELTSKVIIEKITVDTIVLGVIDACWMQELYTLAPLIRSRINNALDTPHIKHVRFQQKGLKKNVLPPMAITQHHHAADSGSRAPLNGVEERALQSITDLELRSTLINFRHRCLQGKRI